MVSSAWIKNPTSRGVNAGKKRVRVQAGSFTQSAGKNHVEFFLPTDEQSVLERLGNQFGPLQLYRQKPNSRSFTKAERLEPRPASFKGPRVFRGQATTCKGQLTITLSGPQGCGKSLVAKMLRDLLPLTPVNAVVIESQV